MKKLVLSVFITLAVIASSHITSFAQTLSKPNVIIIFMDDMGYGDIEPYGMTGIPTPNFNRMAKEGTRFTHFNAGQPVCTASRAALLTGCYPNRLGLSGALLPESREALNLEEETIPALLKKAGYTTGMLGKWHLGNKPPYFPTHFGFDSFYGLPYSNDIWPIDYDGKRISDPSNFRGKWPTLYLYNGDQKVDSVVSLEDQSELTTDLTTRAVDFIKKNKQNPFFLYFAQPMPHVPLAASEKFRGKSEMGLFGDVIMELDWSLGEVLKTLDAEKLTDNTLLIVTSDNGPWLTFGHNAGSSGGFREGKSTSWEGGTRVPLLIRWPGRIEAGGTNSHLMTNMDLLPTILDATSAPSPQKRIDGIDFLPFLVGKSTTAPREVFYYYFQKNSLEGVRYKNWKLVLPHKSTTYKVSQGKDGVPASMSRTDVPMALYDLAHDPGETYDVQQLYPEIVKKIMVFVEEARNDLGDDLTNRKGTNRRPSAIVK